ncbi:MAG: winged helix-turn-helix domain-containing protein [Bacteroidia bacterium]|nr:winged helix-turn-helix domain-containing protein [Bacteroidia bacterium]
MGVKIEFNEQQAAHLLRYYNEQQDVIRGKISELENSLKLNDALIQMIKSQLTVKVEPTPEKLFIQTDDGKTINPEQYKSEWSWGNKIGFIFKTEKRLMTTREIVKAIYKYEPALAENDKSNIKSVSSILSVHSGEGKRFKRVDKRGADNLFGLHDMNE